MAEEIQPTEVAKNLVSNHKFNEKKNIKSVIELIQSGKIISIISDVNGIGLIPG